MEKNKRIWITIRNVLVVLLVVVSSTLIYLALLQIQTHTDISAEETKAMTDKGGQDLVAQWVKTVAGYAVDSVNDIKQTQDGGYIIVGESDSLNVKLGDGIEIPTNGNYDGVIAKYSKEGTTLWGKLVGGAGEDKLVGVVETLDGGLIVVGNFKSQIINLGEGITLTNTSQSTDYADGMIIKYSSSGNIQWAKTISGTYAEELTYVITTKDEGFMVAGMTRSTNATAGSGIDINTTIEIDNGHSSDGMIVKYDKVGNPQWGKAIGGNRPEQAYGLEEMKDGGFLVGGTFSSKTIDLGNGVIIENKSDALEYNEEYDYTSYYTDGMIIKYDKDGNAQWANAVGGNIDDEIRTMTETQDGGFLAVGSFYSTNIDFGNNIKITNNGGQDALILKYSQNGAIEWAKAVGGTGNELLVTIEETRDGGYITTGRFNSDSISLGNGVSIVTNGGQDGMIIKYGSDWNTRWARAVGGTGSDTILSVVETEDGYIVRGSFTSTEVNLGNNITVSRVASYDGWVIKYRKDDIPPTINVTPENGEYAKEKKVTITLEDEGGSELSEENVYEYYLSTSSTSLIGGEWSQYTSGVPTTIGVGKTGTYYLFVKRVKDNAENISIDNGIIQEISGNTYQRFGPYKFDNKNPIPGTITMKQENSTGRAYENNTWTNKNIYIELLDGTDEHSGHKTTTYSISGGKTLTNQTEAITLTETGTYTITVTTTDNVENIATSDEYTIKIDKEAPELTVNPVSTECTKSKEITIRAEENGGSGMSNTNEYQYYLSESDTELIGGEWIQYNSGVATTIGEGKTGTYYLFVKNIEDNAGNISISNGIVQDVEGETYQKFGTYIFDNSSPTVEFTPNGNTEYQKSQSTVVTVTDVGTAGLNESTLRYQWTQSTEQPTEESFETVGQVFANGETITKDGVTGNNWYLWILAKDNLGNKVINRTQAFYLDNKNPTITKAELINNKIKIEANDRDEEGNEWSGIDKYKYITSTEKLENPSMTPENSTEVEVVEEITISNIETLKYIYILVEDKVGNTSEIVEVEIPGVILDGEVNLQTENGKGGVDLNWVLDGKGEKIYKVYQKSEGEIQWQEVNITDEMQLTTSTSPDTANPNKPDLQVEGISENNKININQTATDNGSTYEFYVEAYDKTNTDIRISTSNEITKEVKTGIKGYYYIIESNLDSEFDIDRAIYVEGENLQLDLSNNGKYIRMKAVDVAGNLSEETNTLIRIESKVTVNPNGGKLGESEETKIINGLVGETIELGTPKKEGYTFIGWNATEGIVEGTKYTYGIEDGTITAEWRINQYKYTVEYYYNGIKDENETEEGQANYNEVISSYKDKNREGYIFLEEKGTPLTIKVDEARNVIKVYYAKITHVKVLYINKGTNEVIEEITEEGYVGKEFTSEAKDFEGYVLVDEPEEKKVIMKEEEIKLKYYYTYVSKGVIEKHIDIETGEILYNATYEGNEGDEYKTTPKEFEHYALVEERYPENAEGAMAKEVITVNYYYKKKAEMTIIVKYIDKETNEEIEENVIITDYEWEEYRTEQKEIEGYEFVEVVGQTEGILTENGEVRYYYQKIKQPEPEIPGEGGDDPIIDKPSIDEEQKQPQSPDPTITDKEIPSAGLSKRQVLVIVLVTMSIVATALLGFVIKETILSKKYKK